MTEPAPFAGLPAAVVDLDRAHESIQQALGAALAAFSPGLRAPGQLSPSLHALARVVGGAASVAAQLAGLLERYRHLTREPEGQQSDAQAAAEADLRSAWQLLAYGAAQTAQLPELFADVAERLTTAAAVDPPPAALPQ